jgi:hypothetical protein
LFLGISLLECSLVLLREICCHYVGFQKVEPARLVAMILKIRGGDTSGTT